MSWCGPTVHCTTIEGNSTANRSLMENLIIVPSPTCFETSSEFWLYSKSQLLTVKMGKGEGGEQQNDRDNEMTEELEDVFFI